MPTSFWTQGCKGLVQLTCVATLHRSIIIHLIFLHIQRIIARAMQRSKLTPQRDNNRGKHHFKRPSLKEIVTSRGQKAYCSFIYIWRCGRAQSLGAPPSNLFLIRRWSLSEYGNINICFIRLSLWASKSQRGGLSCIWHSERTLQTVPSWPSPDWLWSRDEIDANRSC